jgi:hypothetical protein
MVCQGNRRDFFFLRDAEKKFVPRLSRRHLDRKFLPLGDLAHLCAFDGQWQRQILADASDQTFIRITASTPQAMVQVRDTQPPSVCWRKLLENVEQDYRIQSARNGD